MGQMKRSDWEWSWLVFVAGREEMITLQEAGSE